MSHVQVNHSPDLMRLQEEGYEIEIRGGYLLTHHVPYVNSERQIRYGTLVTTLALSGNVTNRPDTHVIFFAGEHPCNKDGSIITAIRHGSNRQQLLEGLTVDHMFSNKPANGYTDYYEKVTTYIKIIASPAQSVDPSVTAQTFTVKEYEAEETVFHYPDTNSSRAKINMINAKFRGQKITIIGLGGTGAYVLDLIAKTCVTEIHLYDGDYFLQHNAFRSPGAASLNQLKQIPKKVQFYASMYSNMHRHVIAHDYYLGESNLSELNGMSFVFICVDSNNARKLIMSYLIHHGIPFIDVGLGVEVVDDLLIGAVRVTAATTTKQDHLLNRVPTVDVEDEAYNTNIQIADLNMLNASLAVVKWKKMMGFYQDLIEEYNCSYTINTAQLENNDSTA